MGLSPFLLPVFVLAAPASAWYDDRLARETLLPLASAAYADDPTPCLKGKLPQARPIRKFEVLCDGIANDTCSAFTYVDESRRMIGLVFRGTNSDEQLSVETKSVLTSGLMTFQDGGKVAPYFNDAFFALWNNGGLACTVQELSSKYRDFRFYITGHSLGGSLAAIAALHIVSEGIHDSDKITLYTFGEPRTGNSEFAKLLEFTVEAYRVVHNRDKIPHVPYQSMGYQHHGVEVFYENGMQVGLPFTVCRGDENRLCSNKIPLNETTFDPDHLHYFGIPVLQYGKQGCVDPTVTNG